MLTIKILTRQDLDAAVRYYEDNLDDYYVRDRAASAWLGRGAELLALQGDVDPRRLRDLFAGKLTPESAPTRSATRKDSKSRIGIDLTFSAPKSVSLQALVPGDERIIQAHNLAVARALALAEEHAQARSKVHGLTRVENTRKLIVAAFQHETSRELDPQLHTHAILLNLTQRRDGAWRALRNDEIVKRLKYLGAAYRTELAAELERLGYKLRLERAGTFELAHIERAQLLAFSQRAAQITERLARFGLDRGTATTGQKQTAALATRSPKVGVARAQLHQEWRARAAEVGLDFGLGPPAIGRGGEASAWKESSAGRRVPEPQTPALSEEARRLAARHGVQHAIRHLTERQSVVTDSELVAVAVQHVVGAASVPDVQREIDARVKAGSLVRAAPLYRPVDTAPSSIPYTRESWVSFLVANNKLPPSAAAVRVDKAIAGGGLQKMEERYTTRLALDRERAVLALEREGRGAVTPVLSPEEARSCLSTAQLSKEQREAVLAIATTGNRVIGVQGFAGTGKSHMLAAAKALLEEAGHNVVAVAPYGTQRNALRKLGISDARTLMAFAVAREKRIDERTVLVIDEAGTVPTRLMQKTLRIARDAGARVVLLGDTAQTKAIEAGRPFEQLQAAGMQTARMADIQRQRDPELRRAVVLAAHGRPAESLDHLQTNVLQIGNDRARRARIAADFCQLSDAERAETTMVVGTNEGRREINQAVRRGLGLEGMGREYQILARRDTTREERRFAKNYPVGSLIQPERDYPRVGLRRGELYEVLSVGPTNHLEVRDEAGSVITFSPIRFNNLSVYDQQSAELARGDRVRTTRNDAARDLANGDRFEVLKVTTTAVTISDGSRVVDLPADRPLHLDHAYATTVHGSQGTTADGVVYDAATRSLTTGRDVFYVAISRARQKATVYTDSLERLPGAVSREQPKYAALDLAPT